jgi:hypothetical protein
MAKKTAKKNIKTNKFILFGAAIVVLTAFLYLASNMKVDELISASNADYSRGGNPDYYSLLPKMPSDFSQIRLMWEQGIIRDDPDRINSSYWKQPEWFPLYSENFVSTVNMIADENRLAVWSLGIFDSQIYNRINHDWLSTASSVPETSGKGKIIIEDDYVILQHRFWMRAAPGASKIYGIGLYPVYPGSAYLKGNEVLGIPNETVTQNPEIAKKYFKVTAYESETGSTEFNMGVYWPKLEPEYVREIEVQVEVSKDTPKGIYIVGVDMANPSRSYQEEQSLMYLLRYTDPSIGMSRSPSEFRLFIDVI